jgi:hypothetical protein
VETRLLAYDHGATVSEIAVWANDLIGKEVPGDAGYTVVRVIQFQVINGQSSYDALILVEVTERQLDTQVALKEADIEVIEELTSSIDEPAEPSSSDKPPTQPPVDPLVEGSSDRS